MGRKAKTRRNRYGAWLHYLRRSKALSQEAVSKKTGIPRTTLMFWERTGKLPWRKEILKLAKLYRVPVQKLLRSLEPGQQLSKSEHRSGGKRA
jgi:transcriptional regulator with XRE-family HTH domain